MGISAPTQKIFNSKNSSRDASIWFSRTREACPVHCKRNLTANHRSQMRLSCDVVCISTAINIHDIIRLLLFLIDYSVQNWSSGLEWALVNWLSADRCLSLCCQFIPLAFICGFVQTSLVREKISLDRFFFLFFSAFFFALSLSHLYSKQQSACIAIFDLQYSEWTDIMVDMVVGQ